MAKKPEPPKTSPGVPQGFENFSLETPDGKEISPGSYKGKKPVLLYFWNIDFTLLEINDNTLKKIETKIKDKENLNSLKVLKNKKFYPEELYQKLFLLGLDKDEIELTLKSATEIPVCSESLKELGDFYKKHKNKLEIIAINVGNVRLEVEKFLKEEKPELQIAMDSKGKMSSSLGITRPTLILLDKKTSIIYSYEQTDPERSLKEILEKEIPGKLEE